MCHSRGCFYWESGDFEMSAFWIPAFAGMTIFCDDGVDGIGPSHCLRIPLRVSLSPGRRLLTARPANARRFSKTFGLLQSVLKRKERRFLPLTEMTAIEKRDILKFGPKKGEAKASPFPPELLDPVSHKTTP